MNVKVSILFRRKKPIDEKGDGAIQTESNYTIQDMLDEIVCCA